MILFHGGTRQIKKPDVEHSKKYLDFGRGFYLTTYEEQARRWAKRKASRQGEEAIVNVYEMSDDLQKYKVLHFQNENEQWLDFVYACRKGKNINAAYDIIIGNVADDDVFKAIDMYFRGLWDKARVLDELRYYKINNQICIVKQYVLDQALTFLHSYEVT